MIHLETTQRYESSIQDTSLRSTGVHHKTGSAKYADYSMDEIPTAWRMVKSMSMSVV